MSDSTSTASVFKSRNILLDLLKRQGFDISNYENSSINEVDLLIKNKQLDLLLNNNENNKVYVKYHLDKTMRPQFIHDLITDLFDLEEILTKNDYLIVVVKDEVNDTMQRLLIELFANQNIYIVLFPLARLQYNVLEHSMVPPHKRMSMDEKNNIMKKFMIENNNQFPQISRFDPAALAIGLRPGEICEIKRSSKLEIISNYYRYCVNV